MTAQYSGHFNLHSSAIRCGEAVFSAFGISYKCHLCLLEQSQILNLKRRAGFLHHVKSLNGCKYPEKQKTAQISVKVTKPEATVTLKERVVAVVATTKIAATAMILQSRFF